MVRIKSRSLIKWLLIFNLSLVGIILMPIAFHMRNWVKSIDVILADGQTAVHSLPPTMEHVKEAADTANYTSTQFLNLVGSSTKLVNHATTTIDSLNILLGNSRGLFANANSILDSATGTLNQTTLLLQHTDEHLAPVLDQAQQTFKSADNSLISIERFVSGPLTETSSNVNKILVPAGWLVYDVQQKEHSWLYAPKQRKIVRFYNFVRGVSPFAQPAYYGLKFWEEQK